ncbi:MAG: type I-MYXAN CRISPR-associated Cas8a1/Cmx1 [Phycisphaerales bacterium]|nr:type I-MYXAN CRISPR-associated Cas8a1/Cmx1 [Phycisphaerales bacterium]
MATGKLTSKRRTARAERAGSLHIGLADAGMTPLLRSGLGGLAASIRAHAMRTKQVWPGTVDFGPGHALVEPGRVTFEWGAGLPAEALGALFQASFRIAPPGIIDLPGTYEPDAQVAAEIAAALQDGLKRTFLQHGKTTTKAGGPVVRTIEIDDVSASFGFQPYATFVHQQAFSDVAFAVEKGAVKLASWAYPGAVKRHNAVSASEFQYRAGPALCACFSLVGCLSFQVPRASGGALVIPEPTDLVQFASTRPRLTPRTLADAYVSGPSDAVLAVHLALRMDEVVRGHGGIGNVHGIQLKALPWATQQKSRYGVLTTRAFSDVELDRYYSVRRTLPNRMRVRRSDGSVFGTTSALRAFITDNLARRRPWHADFATATDGAPDPRFIHYYRDRDNLGALFNEERQGLVMMLDHLEEAEHALVRAVHVALRRRFGAIANESREVPGTMKNRFSGERDRWRHAFAGSKTPDQIRAALADLWSRAGTNEELQQSWTRIMPLLRPASWKTARDLALVALASYRGSAEEDVAASAGPTEGDEE